MPFYPQFYTVKEVGRTQVYMKLQTFSKINIIFKLQKCRDSEMYFGNGNVIVKLIWFTEAVVEMEIIR